MIDHGCRLYKNFISCQLHPPAEINFFLVRKKEFVQAPQLMINRSPHKKSSTAGPKTLLNRIILPAIGLTYIKDPSPHKGITEFIDPATTGSCIFKFSFIIISQ